MYDFFSDNSLISPNQSVLRLGNSCINQLVSINFEILNAFDKGLEACGIFFEIWKAFGKILLYGLIFKLCQNGVSRDIINILQDFLCNRKKAVV